MFGTDIYHQRPDNAFATYQVASYNIPLKVVKMWKSQTQQMMLLILYVPNFSIDKNNQLKEFKNLFDIQQNR